MKMQRSKSFREHSYSPSPMYVCRPITTIANLICWKNKNKTRGMSGLTRQEATTTGTRDLHSDVLSTGKLYLKCHI